MSNLTHKYLTVNKFSENLLKWNRYRNKRKMPWKFEKDPYKIWLSEIILQQTRVEQGLSYYCNFIEQFPTVKDLATADEKKVFKLWEGLGYYSRCRNLIATAKFIHTELKGVFPDSYEGLLQLKGVGPYTAAAIASFAFNLPYAVLDGNVFRVLARFFAIDLPIDSTAGRKKFAEMAGQALDKKKAALYNQAIMDFGATVCKPVAPDCHLCALNQSCRAFAEGKVQVLPVKEKTVKQRTRFFYFFLIRFSTVVAIRERAEKDIWRHLHEFPIIELDSIEPPEKAIETAVKRNWIREGDVTKVIKKKYTQKLTHQTIHAFFIECEVEKNPKGLGEFEWSTWQQMQDRSFPRIINDYFSDHYPEYSA
ncbi:A/G-specific adenine glycosylase [Niabella insulamsoli]|uniref:A/G-specific adenine glycosylase n=1 Tax=Niabella insulamsoli TaxID=3144874 RepID=UPI0031FE0CF6